MPIQHYTNKNAVQLLSTQSRRADISSLELRHIHIEMGKYIAYQMLDHFDLQEKDIQHVQGVRKGVELIDKNNIIILPLMRAGLYAAEGVRSVFTESQFIPYNSDKDVEKVDFQDKIIIVVDSVINTGKSVCEVINTLQIKKPRKIIITTLVMQKEAMQLSENNKKVSFYALRISENKYTGKGGTDTGNRLFNTL